MNFYNLLVNKFINDRLEKYKIYNNLELYISFVSPAKIRSLKNELFGLDIVTDVISVPIDTDDVDKNIPAVFGEIFICAETAARQAKEYLHSFQDEIALLIVHGLLHLIGYDDETEEQQKIMRREEKAALVSITN